MFTLKITGAINSALMKRDAGGTGRVTPSAFTFENGKD